jgi:CheY-like chemotaxis protein
MIIKSIIFADVLLPKKSGYEVGKELKNDSETKNIPLVLMWSNFI